MTARSAAAGGAFAASSGLFSGITGWLDGDEAAALTHSGLEEQLGSRGRELTRVLLQDHLDLRAAREQRRAQVSGSDGVTRTRAEAGHTRPLDAGAAITRSTGIRAGKRQVEELAVRAAADADAFYAARRPGPAADEVLLVLQFDGKGIVMRPEALRPATAKAAASAQNKLATRLSPGEKHGRKRMAELAAVHDAVPALRTAADIITPPGSSGQQPRSRGPRARPST
ncbi:MAG: hypothetical protein WBH47_26005 [Streptosporangiaceae bacterium]